MSQKCQILNSNRVYSVHNALLYQSILGRYTDNWRRDLFGFVARLAGPRVGVTLY